MGPPIARLRPGARPQPLPAVATCAHAVHSCSGGSISVKAK